MENTKIDTFQAAYDLLDYFGGKLPTGKNYMDLSRPYFLKKGIPSENRLWERIYQEAEQLLAQP